MKETSSKVKTKPNNTTSKNAAKSLTAIFLVAAILAGTIYGLNWLLADQFEKNALEAERKIPRMVLPEGNFFDQYDGKLVEDVSACYIASNGAGIAVVVEQEITHGGIQIMVGVNSEGQITNIVIQNQENAKGNDAGITNPEYLSIYIGRTVLSADHISDDYEIDPVAGAEEASNAVYQAVRIAFRQQAVIENDNEGENNAAPIGGGN
jgi:Na+-translocating ferredoxin:NAD+ oxidoreductase RnfG subunit